MTPREFLLAINEETITLEEARRLVDELKLNPAERAQAIVAMARLEARENYGDSERNILFEIVPRESWLWRYINWCQISESPTAFHLMAALCLLSHQLGRSRFFPLHGEMIFAPVSVFLVSPAGQARRGGAIKPAVRIGQRANCTIIMDQVSPEGLIQSIADVPHQLLVAEEASTLLSSRDYVADIPQFLCRCLDCDDKIERNLKSGPVSVVNPTVSALFGSAPTWFYHMPRTAVGGGMMSRFIVVYEHEQERVIPFPGDLISVEANLAKEVSLAEELVELKSLPGGELKYVGAAHSYYAAWYRDNYASKIKSHEKLTPWFSRKAAHVHRISMALLASQGRPPEVDVDTFDRATSLLKILEEKMQYAYAHLTQEKYETRRHKLCLILSQNGGSLMRSELWKKSHSLFKDVAEFDAELQTVMSIGEIKALPEKGRTGRPGVRYKLTRV